MADNEIFGLSAEGIRRTAKSNELTLGRLPDIGRRTRRVPPVGSSGGAQIDPSGNGGSSGCACCGCLNCVDLCKQNPETVVTGCEGCAGGATKFRTVKLGKLGSFDLANTGSGCGWVINFDYNGTTYLITLTEAGASSTLTVAWVSGDDDPDPLRLKSGDYQISYKADPDKVWSCLCNSTMIPAIAGEVFPRGLDLDCEICISPRADDNLSWVTCGVDAGCVTSITFPGATYSRGGPEISLTSGDPNASNSFTTGLANEGSARPCCWDTIVSDGDPDENGYVFPSPSNPDFKIGINLLYYDAPDMPWFWWARVCVSATQINVIFYFAQGPGTAHAYYFGNVFTSLYRIDLVDIVAGTNVFDLISQTDPTGESTIVWPEAIDIELGDCTYGAVNPEACTGPGGGSDNTVDPEGCSKTTFGRCCYTDGGGNHCADGLSECDCLKADGCFSATGTCATPEVGSCDCFPCSEFLGSCCYEDEEGWHCVDDTSECDCLELQTEEGLPCWNDSHVDGHPTCADIATGEIGGCSYCVTPEECGTCPYTSLSDGMGGWMWFNAVPGCTGECGCVPPAIPPSGFGQNTTTDCA